MVCRVLLLLCLFVVAKLCGAHLELAYSDQEEQIYTCEIDGMVDQNVHQLHGTLVNCQSPPMECWVHGDEDEYLVKSRTNVHCRVPSEDLFFNDDKECSFRFYYRRSYCFYTSRCYSLTMSCRSIVTGTVLFYFLVAGAALLVVIVVVVVFYCLYECCWRTTALSIPKQEKRLESVRRRSLKQKQKDSVRRRPEQELFGMETSF